MTTTLGEFTTRHDQTNGVDVCHIRADLDTPRFRCGAPIDEPLHTVHPGEIRVTPCVVCGRPRCPLCANLVDGWSL